MATWRLLSMVAGDRIFSAASLVWVDVIVGAVAAAWVVLVGLCGVVTVASDDPALPFLLVLSSVGVAVMALLLLVLRALLRQATALRSDMDAVI